MPNVDHAMFKFRTKLDSLITSDLPNSANMTNSTLFSAPVSVILNRRLLSQRGGIIPPTQQSKDSLRFKLFINSNPLAVRYGLTLQISALREMSKEHNFDQIPEHQARIFFPAKSLFRYNCTTPTRYPITEYAFEELGIDEEQTSDIELAIKMFWIKSDADFKDLRLLRFFCWNTSVDKTSIPKLRSERLESELKRIFGTVKTANEIDEACLEIECLLEALGGTTDKAVWAMHDAALRDLQIREAKERASLMRPSPSGDKTSWRTRNLANNESVSDEKTNSSEVKSASREQSPKKLAVPAIINGKFTGADQNPFLSHEKCQMDVSFTSSTPQKSPNRYLHPHSFDVDAAHHDLTNDNVHCKDTSLGEATGSKRNNWRCRH